MMTTTHSSENYLLVAIDVAKRAHNVLVRWPSGRSQAFKVSNQRNDFQRLIAFYRPWLLTLGGGALRRAEGDPAARAAHPGPDDRPRPPSSSGVLVRGCAEAASGGRGLSG